MTRGFSVSFMTFLLTADFICAMSAVRLAAVVRAALSSAGIGKPIPMGNASPTAWWFYIVFPVAWLIITNATGAYSPRQTYRLLLEIVVLLKATFISIFIFFGILYMTSRTYSHLQASLLVALAGGLTAGYRIAIRFYFRLTGGRTYDSRRVLVVGTGELAQQISRQVRAYAWTGVFLAGYAYDDALPETTMVMDAPILGKVSQVVELLDKHAIDEVILALEEPDYTHLRELVQQLHECGVAIRFAPDLREMQYLFSTVEELEKMPLIGLREPRLSSSQRLVKRVLDVTLSTILLILALPLLIIVALGVVFSSPGPVIFAQERIGEGMRPFKMYKFRTMVKDAEKRQAEVTKIDENGNVIHKDPADPRVTRFGRFLRRTSIDEIPQLINVIKGDMSLVGPRPEMPWIVSLYQPWQKKRFEIPAGMTGWWQINGRAGTMMHLSTEDDLYYIQNYSIWLDFIILLRTIPAVFGRRGAF
ncbi:MAG: sugar transferase [Chloroflexi bacterium]|nr:sugar transferase [Chloroflexota bacterium]